MCFYFKIIVKFILSEYINKQAFNILFLSLPNQCLFPSTAKLFLNLATDNLEML